MKHLYIKWEFALLLVAATFAAAYFSLTTFGNQKEKACQGKIEYVEHDWMDGDYYNNCTNGFVLGYDEAKNYKHYSKDQVVSSWYTFNPDEIERITFSDKPEDATVVIRVFGKATNSVDDWLSLYKGILINFPNVSDVRDINDPDVGIKNLRQVSYQVGTKTYISNLIVTPKSNLAMELLKSDSANGTQFWNNNSSIVHAFYPMTK